jgi:hypothetical protein
MFAQVLSLVFAEAAAAVEISNKARIWAVLS